MSHSVESRYALVLSRRSILDTLFLFKTPNEPRGKPAYATTTDGSITTLWRIDGLGRMSEVSQIIWPSDSGQSHQVLINGQLMLVDNVLQRSKRLFGSDSRTFAAGTMRFKWKRGRPDSLSPSPQRQSRESMHTPLQVWACYENATSTARTIPDGSRPLTSAPPVVALFFPPQAGSVKSEMTIYPNGEAIVDHIVLTALLLCARKDEWRTSRSVVAPRALEASLRADIRGSLPPYLPTAPARSRVRSSTHRQRPHTSTSTRTRPASSQGPPTTYTRLRPTSSQAPPPYTSVDDVSSRSS